MTYLVNAYDYKDSEALGRRNEVRSTHLAGIKKLIEENHVISAVAMVNDEDNLCGSSLVVDFNSREELDQWLENEPYVKNKVWEKVDVIKCIIPKI